MRLPALVALLLAPCVAWGAEVEVFSPQGEVKDVRQVSARFTTDVVDFGDPRLPAPFDVACPAEGEGRWADARNWVYDFTQDLEAGVACTFTIAAGFRDRAGRTLTGPQSFAFNTGGPAIRRSLPYGGSRDIDENQVFLLALDAAATAESIEEHAWCEVDGIGERIPLRVLTGDERSAVLEQRRLLGYAYLRFIVVRDADARVLGGGRLQSRQELDAAEARIAVVQCRRALPAEHRVSLVWGAGVAPPAGAATQEVQRLDFRVRDDFLARFTCRRTSADADCLPMLPMGVEFTAPVARALATRATLVSTAGTTYRPEPVKEDRVESITFAGPFAERDTMRLHLPDDLTDDVGRALANRERFPLEVKTDEAPPLAKFSGRFGILEAREGGILPVTLRNLDGSADAATTVAGRSLRVGDPAAVYGWMQRIEETTTTQWRDGGPVPPGTISVLADAAAATPLSVIKPGGAREFEVVAIPLQQPGLYVVELESPRLGRVLNDSARPYYVPTMALVTDLSVHLQWGLESSSVWVTRLHDGSVVADAAVEVLDACTGNILWSGRTATDGVATVGDDLPEPRTWVGCNDWSPHDLLVAARVGDDFSFTLASWHEGISPSEFGNIASSLYGRVSGYAHSVLDRALFRAGETVSMKHYLRDPAGDGLRASTFAPDQLVIRHHGSGKSFEMPVSFDATGIAESSWAIPRDVPLGSYGIELHAGDDQRQSGSFRVEQYKLPTSRAQVQGPRTPLIGARHAPLDLQVNYLAGGGAALLPVKLRTLQQPRVPQFRRYEEFRFGGEPVREGLSEESAGGWFPEFDEDGQLLQATNGAAQTLPLTLDAMGTARVSAPLVPAPTAQDLVAELEYADANGQILTVARRLPLWPSRLSIGLRTEGWIASADGVDVKLVVLDTQGVPQRDVRVSVEVFQREVHSYRKRLVGGFYSYAHSRKTVRLPDACSGRTDELGLLSCHLEPGVSGELLVQARARDEQQRETLSVMSVWVAGDDDWWFEQQANNRMDLLPEKKEYGPQETARFQVRMPFREATALVSVQREGVLEHFVTSLSGSKPVVEVPLKGSYAPNVFVSVLAVRGRPQPDWLDRLTQRARTWWSTLVDGDAPPPTGPTALADLSRPAFRLGLANIGVGVAAHRLDVDVRPERRVYQTRERAQVDIAVRAPDGKPAAGAEIAVAAVDEALLELQPNPSWDLLDAMMAPRPLSVLTATAQMQVVGKRRYGRKTAPPGGGGGRMSARELFDSLLLWQGRVQLDANGHARIDVPLNDALTSFRIVAVASRGIGLFGTGSATIRTHQDLQLTAALPAVVRENDRFRAAFTVRNASAAALQTTVQATLDGQTLPQRVVDIPAGEAREAAWDVTVPAGRNALAWDVRADAGSARDRLKAGTDVVDVHPVRVYQATLGQLDRPLRLPVARPVDAIAGRGGIRVEFMEQLGGSLDGVREYMSRYPWTCLEQRLSRAVVLDDTALWEAVKADLPLHADSDGLLRYYPVGWLAGSDTLTAYVMALTHETGWEIPEQTRERLISGLQGIAQGRIVRSNPLDRADQTERRLAALEALSRHGAARSEWVDALEFQPNLLPTSALLDWIGVLQRVDGVARREARRAQALQVLRSRINFQGTVMTFATEDDDAWWWLMASADRNAVTSVLRVLDERQWQADLPRLWRGAWLRQKRGHWDTTPANAWGALAARRFAARFEKDAVTGRAIAALSSTKQTHDWREPTGVAAFPWPDAPAQLEVRQDGSGAPWAIVQSRAAVPLTSALSSGYRIDKSMTPLEAGGDGYARGDLWRVRLEIDAQSDMTWVAVEDPIPPGAMVLGSGLGGDSTLLVRGEQREGRAWPAYEERRQDSFRAYYEFVPKGRFTLEYTLRLNTPGRFELPTTRVEAMYAPEMFGERPNAPIEVRMP